MPLAGSRPPHWVGGGIGAANVMATCLIVFHLGFAGGGDGSSHGAQPPHASHAHDLLVACQALAASSREDTPPMLSERSGARGTWDRNSSPKKLTSPAWVWWGKKKGHTHYSRESSPMSLT